MSVPDPELLLLRRSACALLRVDGAHDLPARRAIDWHRLLWLGRRHGALLLLHESLRENPAAHPPCPAEIRAQLGELAAAARLQSLARAAEISRLHDLFALHDVAVVVTDDWSFQHAFSPDRALIEFTSEIRLAVSPPLEARARALLAEAGQPEAGVQFQIAPSGRTPVRLENGFDLPGLWDNGSALPLGNRRLHVPDPRQWLWLFAARHGSRTLTLLYAFQVMLVVQQLDRAWPDLFAQAAAVGLEPAVRRVVAASHEHLDLPLPFATKIDSAPLPSKAPDPRADNGELPISPFLPTPVIVAERMLALAGVGPDDVVCDLGCGDGRLVIAAARKFGARGVGIDRDPVLLAAAAAQAIAEGVEDKVSFVCADLFSADVQAASVICFYLLPALCEPLRKRLLPHARPGTRIVSHDYSFPDWPPEKTELVRAAPARIAQIYLWRVGGNPTA